MKRLARILCIVLAFALCFSIVACGGSGKKLSSDEKGVYYLDDDGVKVYKVVMMNHGVPSTTADKDKKYRQTVLDKINEEIYKDLGYKVDIEVRVYSDDTFSDKLATALADGEQLDLVRQTSKDNLNSYVDQGIAKNINKYLTNATSLKENISEQMMQEVTYDGGVYAIPLDKLPVNDVAYVRGDLLKKAGYDNLTTMDEWEGFLKKVYEGGKDYLNTKMVPVPLMGLLSTFESLFLGNYTDTPGTFFDDNGNMLPVYFNDGYKQFILKMRDWVEKGYIDSSMFNFNEFSMSTNFTNQITAAVACGIYHLEFGSLLSVDKAHEEWDLTPIMPIAKSKYYTEGLMGEYVFVPYCAKSAGVAVDLLNWALYDEDNYMLLRCGILDTTYTLDANNSIDIPESEKTSSITQPSDLIGNFFVGTSVRMNMGYPSATCPGGAIKAYADSLAISEDKLYVDPYIYVSSYLTDNEKSKIAKADGDADKVIQKMLTLSSGNLLQVSDADFESAWAKMLSDYTNTAGSVYQKLTTKYNELFA